MAKIKNIDVGPRGFWDGANMVTLEAGQTSDDLDLDEDTLDSALEAGWFEVEDDDSQPKKGKKAKPDAEPAPEPAPSA